MKKSSNSGAKTLFIILTIIFLFMWTYYGSWVLFLYFIYAASSVKILKEYDRGVLFTLGRFSGVVGPGLVFIIPFVQRLKVVGLRIVSVDIPEQEVITKDNVSVKVNAVVFFRVVDPAKAILGVRDYVSVTVNYAQTTLRDVAGGVTLDELLEKRDRIAKNISSLVDRKTDEWGVDIIDIKIQDVILPTEMRRAMAAQAEAEREKRAVIIKAEGEKIAAQNYAKAAKVLSSTKGGLTLRVLQTVSDISKDPSQKFFFLLPIELADAFLKKKK